MNSLIYVWKRSAVNTLKKLIRKPAFWVYLLILGFYAFIMYHSILEELMKRGMNRPETLVAAVSALILYLSPLSYSAYAKRQGMLFRNSDVHFIFPSPVSPKLCLLYGQAKTLLPGLCVELLAAILGTLWFRIPPLKMLVYFTVIGGIGTVMEAALVICLYGNERLKKETLARLGYLLYGIVVLLLLLGFWYLRQEGFRFSAVTGYLSSPGIQMIPLVGWQIAAMRLILLGPDSVNTVGTVLFLLSACGLLSAAVRMKCTGECFEDAMQFADNYEQVLEQKKKNGTGVLPKNRKLKKVRVEWRGTGAKAILFRQWLEYRKVRFFLFNAATLVNLAVGCVLIYLDRTGRLEVPQEFKVYVLLALAAYLMLVFGSLPNKWTKELENPYVFLIPDRPVYKIWYATCLEHVKSAVNMILLVFPAGVAMGVRPLLLVLLVWIGAAAGGVRIYSDTITRAVFGNAFGSTGRSLLQMVIAWTFIGIAIPFFLAGLFLLGETAAFLAAGLYLMAAAFVLMLAGSQAFTRMELQEM